MPPPPFDARTRNTHTPRTQTTHQLRVWRAGAALDVAVRLSTPRQLVPAHSHDAKPQYLVFAGFVFTPLTVWYLKVCVVCV